MSPMSLPKPMWIWVALAVAVDLVVTWVVVSRALAKKRAAAAAVPASMPNLGVVWKFAKAMHPRIGEIVRTNWSGDATALPGVLAMAVDEADREARAQGLTLDRVVLKDLVQASVAKHGVARRAMVLEALKRVA